jgi:hypothetical protein
VLGLLAALPVVGALSALLETGTEAGGRRKRRKTRNTRRSGDDKENRTGKGKGKRKGKRKDKNRGTPASEPVAPAPAGCTPTTCATQGKNCGTISDGCSGTLTCGTCSNPTPACVNKVCAACSTSSQCATNQLCDGGACQTCDVCANGCTHTTVQGAIDAATSGDTIRICPGTYPRYGGGRVANIDSKNLTLIGAGAGDGGTVFDGGGGETSSWVVSAYNAEAELRDLKVTGGKISDGAGGGIFNYHNSHLTLTGVLVTGNTANLGGGIYNQGTLILNDGTAVTANTAVDWNSQPAQGGGIRSTGSVIHNEGSSVSGNTPDDCYGC